MAGYLEARDRVSVTVKPRRRRTRRWLTAVTVLVVAVVALTIKIYVFPRSDQIHKADVIFVLGSGDPERYELGARLYKEGYAGTLVFSIPRTTSAFPGCEVPLDGAVATCFLPSPATTRGEAAELARMSAKHGWTSAIVITINPHLIRAESIVRKCNHGDLMFVGVQPQYGARTWIYQFAYQTAGFVKSMLETDCNALIR